MAKVTIAQGKLSGGLAKSDNGTPYYEFLGIPYAKPPVGNLRFKSPQEGDSWEGERDATTINENNICCQQDTMKGGIMGSEDCLYINVYTPKLPESESKLLPVMVFVHGGGFIYTNGIVKKDMGPDYLIDHDVVVVTFNYRLGILGFLSLDIPDAAGNMGLKDQVLALKWVQKNIEKFGGDRNNVTVFGLSAGSASVDYLLLSPLSKGLFHKAILLSGSSLNHWAINYEPKKIITEVLKKMGYSGPIDNNRAIYEYLHTSPLSLLVESSYDVIQNYPCNRNYFGFVPTIEKDFGDGNAFITDNPYRLYKEGKFHAVPVIKGFCNKEGYLMGVLKPKELLDLLKNKNFVDYLSYEIDENERNRFNERFLSLYSDVKEDDDKDTMGVDFFSDLDFISGCWISGQMMASKVPVYFYVFGYEGNINFFKNYFGMKRKGAAHGDDFTYLFKHDTISPSCKGKDAEVRAKITKLFTNFAKTSNPTPDADLGFKWPEYTTDSQTYLNIEETFNLKTNFEPKKMAAFKDLYEKYLK